MNKEFKLLDPLKLENNIFDLIGKDWMLITAGNIHRYNTMTGSWGGFGVLWNRNICLCFVRPSRYTYQFLQETEHFTLSFFGEEYRKALSFCGSNSGRNVDKAATTGISPMECSPTTVSFQEAQLIAECKKLYFQDLDPNHFLDPTIDNNYKQKDYHRLYIGEIIRLFHKEY